MRRRPRSAGQTQRRRRKRHVINKKRLVLTMLLVTLGVEVAFVVFTCPVFYVRKIRPVGNRTISSAEIVQALDIPPESNVFLIRKAMVVRQALKNPVVKEARVYRRPPGTLVLRIVERKPHAVLDTGGTLYEVDSSGVPFRAVKEASADVPVIFCDLSSEVVFGKPLDDSAFKIGRECLLLAQQEEISGVAKITVDQNHHLCLNVRDDFEIRLGRPEQLSEKLGIAAQAMKQIPRLRQHGEYIDVTCPKAPVMKLGD